MIYNKEGSAGGEFNQFLAQRHLADVAEYIQCKVSDCGLPSDAGTILGSIRLDRSRSLYVSGDALYFCCTFDCYFQSNPDQDIDDAYGTYLDVTGRILFHPMGTKKYDLFFSGVHSHYQYPDEEKNYAPKFPGVQVNQMLYPAFGANEKQRHKLLEAEAARFLTQYWPDALQSVSPVPIRQIAEDKMGLQVYTGYKLPEKMDSLGMTLFQSQRVTVTDEETGEQMTRRFLRGSILIDSDTLWERGFGSFNFTLAHEIYHWFAHRVHMAFMDIVGRPEHYDIIRGHLESQANGVGARILMRGQAVEQKYQEEMERLSSDGLSGDTEADASELAATACAAFFGASKMAMKKRLQELGLCEEIRRPSVRYRLDIVEMFEYYLSDTTFRDLLDCGMYRYVNGYVVRNDPKYVQDDRLTGYARQHPSECIMAFREEYRTAEEGSSDVLFRKDAYFSRRADYDERMARDPVLMERLANRLRKMKDLYVSSLDAAETFCDFIMPIITAANTRLMGLDVRDEVDDGFDEGKLVMNSGKRYRSRYIDHYDFQSGKTVRITEPEVFQTQTMVGYKMFEKMRRNDWNNPDLDMVMAVCAGYHLNMEMTEKALLRAGYLLLPHIPTHLVYQFLVSHCRDQYKDTGTFNTLLILLGEKEIGTNKRESKRAKKK